MFTSFCKTTAPDGFWKIKTIKIMKSLSVEKMEATQGGSCPWWAGGLVDTVFTAAGLCCVSAPPAAAILAVGGFVAGLAVDYACQQ